MSLLQQCMKFDASQVSVWLKSVSSDFPGGMATILEHGQLVPHRQFVLVMTRPPTSWCYQFMKFGRSQATAWFRSASAYIPGIDHTGIVPGFLGEFSSSNSTRISSRTSSGNPEFNNFSRNYYRNFC